MTEWAPEAPGTVGLSTFFGDEGFSALPAAFRFTAGVTEAIDTLSVYLRAEENQEASLLCEVFEAGNEVPGAITTSTFQPNDDLQIGGDDSEDQDWLTQALAATNLYDMLDDASDATYIFYYGTVAGRKRYRFNVATAGALWPANQRVVGGRVVVRTNREETNGRLQVSYFDGTNTYILGTVTATQQRQNLTVRWPEYNPATRLPWTRAEIQALDGAAAIQLRPIGVGNQKSLKVYRAYLELDWVTENRVAVGVQADLTTASFGAGAGSSSVPFDLRAPVNAPTGDFAKVSGTEYTVVVRRVDGLGLFSWGWVAESAAVAEALLRPTGAFLPVSTYDPLLDSRGMVSVLGDPIEGRAAAFSMSLPSAAGATDSQPYATINLAPVASGTDAEQEITTATGGTYTRLRALVGLDDETTAILTVKIKRRSDDVLFGPQVTLTADEARALETVATVDDVDLKLVELEISATLATTQYYVEFSSLEAVGSWWVPYADANVFGVAPGATYGGGSGVGDNSAATISGVEDTDSDLILTLSTQPAAPVGFSAIPVPTAVTAAAEDGAGCTIPEIETVGLSWLPADTDEPTAAVEAEEVTVERFPNHTGTVTTTSLSPTDDALIVCQIAITGAVTIVPPSDLTGLGLNWTMLTFVRANDTAPRGIAFYVAQGIVTPGALSFTLQTGTFDCSVCVTEYRNAYNSGDPLDAIRQFPMYNAGDNRTDLSQNFDQLASADSMAVAVFLVGTSGVTFTKEAAWDYVVNSPSSPGGAFSIAYVADTGTTDLTSTITWQLDHVASTFGIVFEIIPYPVPTGETWAPVFHMVGEGSGGSGAITVKWPYESRDGYLANFTEVWGILCMESRADQPIDTSGLTADGWALMPDSPGTAGAGATSTAQTVLYKQADTATEPDLVIPDAGDHTYGVIFTIRLCAGIDDATASADLATTSLTADGTTAVGDNLIAYITARALNSSAAVFSGEANAGLIGFFERFDGGTASGGGGGIGVWTGTKNAAGATGTTTATISSSSDMASLAVSFLGLSGPAAFDFARYEIQRLGFDGVTWETIYELTDEETDEVTDWESRRGQTERYRMRSIRDGDWVPSPWTDIEVVSVTNGSEDVVIGSNHAQAAFAYIRDPDYDWNHPQAQAIVALAGDYGQRVYREAEDRGDTFPLPIVLFAGEDAHPEPTIPGRYVFEALREFLRSDVPHFSVADRDGWRWFADVAMPSSARTEAASNYRATLQVTESQRAPTPAT